ncbi:MAG: carbohydrate kinase family protein [Candidatus Levybacteria bacterium]|nr:carbohydrate kinase family protein [Candidatus Levybacteria bacterium]MDZ4228492.1 carbohydrate kinase family protein [Candidatus Levybacteria bacterium]
MSNFDIICIGNAKIDTFLTLHEASEHLRLIKETNELCIKFGDKIPVDKAEILLGGNAANVAVGASRLGLTAGIVAEIGKDEFAQKIISTLSNEGIDVSNITQTEGQQSSFSTIINFKGERTIFSEHVIRKHNFNFENIATPWVYLTSLGNAWLDAYNKTFDFIKETKSKLAFNPGTLQIERGKSSIENVLSVTDLLFVNKEEGEELLDYPHGQKSIEEIIANLQKFGPKIAVITDGKNGSYVIGAEGKVLKGEIVEATAVEKTGAGDAYSSGFLGAILHGKRIEEAMSWGAKNSASVIGKVGAQDGLLHKADFEKL